MSGSMSIGNVSMVLAYQFFVWHTCCWSSTIEGASMKEPNEYSKTPSAIRLEIAVTQDRIVIAPMTRLLPRGQFLDGR
jgi:hypothetical protein